MGRREDPVWAKNIVALAAARERGDGRRHFQSRLTVTRTMIDRLGLEKELHGHMGCVNCLEWNRDGSVLASASDDLHVILWDPFRYKQLHNIATGHNGNIFSVKLTSISRGRVAIRNLRRAWWQWALPLGMRRRPRSIQSFKSSASDDLHVILWDPFRYKQLHNIATGHNGNIFSVKFLSPDIVATCAADGTVRARSVISDCKVLECSCHCGRVKRLATAPDNPHLMWSAGEDGLILQHDLRTNHSCNSNTANVLVNLLNHLGRYAEAKCVAVNPRRPYQLAVGANDFYVRLYDVRMIKLAKLQVEGGGGSGRQMWERQNVRCARAGHGDPEHNIPRQAVQYYAPGHLSMEPNEHTFPKKATTYVAFSHDGNELLINLGSEQVYIFDINTTRRPVLVESFIIQHNHGNRDESKHAPRNGTNGTNGTSVVDPPPVLPPRVRELKEAANELMNTGGFSKAVELYNVAISQCSDCAILYSNRAAALMRRGWSGDTYAAVRDCYAAIKLDPHHVKAHFRLAKALMELQKSREAQECLRYFQQKFPRHAASHAVFLLQKDINVALEKLDTQPDEADEADDNQPTSVLERQLRASALDYSHRFLGHCNTTTDIKEANFLGPNAGYVAAGSDDGSLFIWCRESGNIVRCLRGDDSIVNCVQMHPSCFLLATSGIESVVRLWSPRPEDGGGESREVSDCGGAAAANQQRMRSDPFEAMLLNISFAGAAERDLHSPACRPT